jgi:predicted RND superfamily exporter protein
MNSFFAGLAAWVVRNRIIVVIAVALMTGFLAMNAKNLKLIIDPNSLMPQSHPYVSTTNLVERVFGSKYVIVIGLRPKSGDIFQEAVLSKVADLTQKLNETPGVSRSNLLSLYAKRAKDIKGSAEGLIVTPIGRPGNLSPEDLSRVKESLVRNPVYQSILVSPDQRMTAIVVEMKEQPGGFRAMMEPINRLVAQASNDQLEVFVGGNPVFLAASEKFSARMAILFPLAILIVGLIHFEAFRTFQGLFLPLLTAITSVVWGLGVMGLFRVPLDVFNTPTPILILAVAAGHAVQLLKRYYEEYNRLVGITGMSRLEAKRQAVVDSIAGVGPVMFIAALVAAPGLSLVACFRDFFNTNVRSVYRGRDFERAVSGNDTDSCDPGDAAGAQR